MDNRVSFIRILAMIILSTVMISCSGEKEYTPFDAKSGFVSHNHLVPDSALIPIPVLVDSDHKYFYCSDCFLFLGQEGDKRYVVIFDMNRALNDNRYDRAQRDFRGKLYDGHEWINLPYTRSRYDSPGLETLAPYYFGGAAIDSTRRLGEIHYDRREVKFDVHFSDLFAVHHLRDGEEKLHTHAVGNAVLAIKADTIAGTLFHELLQLEGFNRIVDHWNGIDFVDFDRIALLSETGTTILAMSDSASARNRILKNFLAIRTDDSLLYAEGAEYVQVESSEFVTEAGGEMQLAIRKEIAVPELDLKLSLILTADRIVNRKGETIALVDGELTIAGESERVWGVLEHIQKPKTQSQQLH